jgi:predicted signal transduction protein with EAL and GGDEF domain
MVRLRRRFVDRRRPIQRLCLHRYPCRDTDRRYRIDKIFVEAIGIDRNSATIVETLIELAHNMRMNVVADGAETFE